MKRKPSTSKQILAYLSARQGELEFGITQFDNRAELKADWTIRLMEISQLQYEIKHIIKENE